MVNNVPGLPSPTGYWLSRSVPSLSETRLVSLNDGFGEPGGSYMSDEGVCRIEREAVVHGMYLAQRIG